MISRNEITDQGTRASLSRTWINSMSPVQQDEDMNKIHAVLFSIHSAFQAAVAPSYA